MTISHERPPKQCSSVVPYLQTLMRPFISIVILLAIGQIGCSENRKQSTTEKPVDSTNTQVAASPNVDECIEFALEDFLKTNGDHGTDGVFDTMYQRIQFHFESIQRDKMDGCVYHISGYDRLKGLVTPFNGQVKIEKIKKNVGNIYEPEKPSDDKLVEFTGAFQFREDNKAKGSGVFAGTVYFMLTLNKENKLVDDLGEYMGDGFYNFIYDGSWTSYKSGKVKKCVWGEGRLPNTGDFDIGDGDIVVNEKYLKNGWEHDENWRLIDNPMKWWAPAQE
jgi:hypothetical protein